MADVEPQRAWLREAGDAPAYFIQQRATESQLEDQHELVIIVPCQEGDEMRFIRADPYLKRIALNARGEVSRVVLSPMLAKGLEFDRVVLYQFGAEAVTRKLVEQMAWIGQDTTTPREETLALEYYFNATYVAASRAQRRLLIVDSEPGLQQFWSFATDSGAIDTLLSAPRNRHWQHDDLFHMVPGDNATWSQDRDDPVVIANHLFEQGRSEQSDYLLQLARSQFERLHDERQVTWCNALIYEIGQQFALAAACYEELHELADAIRCYWQVPELAAIDRIATAQTVRFGNDPVVIGARYLLTPRSEAAARNLFQQLIRIERHLPEAVFEAARWHALLEQAISDLAVEYTAASHPFGGEWVEIWQLLQRLQQRSALKLRLNPQIDLARLAFHADDIDAALAIWQQLPAASSVDQPQFILRALAQRSDYPENLLLLGRLSDCDAVVGVFDAHRSHPLTLDQQQAVLSLLIECSAWPQAVQLLQHSDHYPLIVQLLTQLATHRADDTLLMQQLLIPYLESALAAGDFTTLYQQLFPAVNERSLLQPLFAQQPDLPLRLLAVAVRKLASDPELTRAQIDRAKLATALLQQATGAAAAELVQHITPESLGAVLEQITTATALQFYEFIVTSKVWGSDQGTQLNAKEGVLRCRMERLSKQKRRLRERGSEKDRNRFGKARSDLKRLSSQWGLPIPEKGIPTLAAISHAEMAQLLGVELPVEAVMQQPVAAEIAPTMTLGDDGMREAAPRLDYSLSADFAVTRNPLRTSVQELLGATDDATNNSPLTLVRKLPPAVDQMTLALPEALQREGHISPSLADELDAGGGVKSKRKRRKEKRKEKRANRAREVADESALAAHQRADEERPATPEAAAPLTPSITPIVDVEHSAAVIADEMAELAPAAMFDSETASSAVDEVVRGVDLHDVTAPDRAVELNQGVELDQGVEREVVDAAVDPIPHRPAPTGAISAVHSEAPAPYHLSVERQPVADASVAIPLRPTVKKRIRVALEYWRDLRVTLLPHKRRLEMLDSATDNLVLVSGRRMSVSSDDLTIAAVEPMRWEIAEWRLQIVQYRLHDELLLVELCDLSGHRILALAL